MRTGAGLSLVVALAFGALATFLVRSIVQGSRSGDTTAATTTLVVAAKAVPFGAPLTADNLREVPWRAAEPLSGSFATIAELLKDGRRLALVSLQASEPVIASRITAPDGRASLSTQLDEGMRAVTVRVDEVRGVAGFVLPGDRVDLILTRGENGQEATAFADVLLQNAKVLAIDQLADERQDKPSIARAVTLELTVQQAQRVVLAQGIGRLSLALRQPNGAATLASGRVTVGDLGPEAAADAARVAQLEKELEQMKAATAAARTEADRELARRLAEAEARLRSEMRPPPPAITPPRALPAISVVTVTRNGSKTENYNVASER